jgi:hypothetical protein
VLIMLASMTAIYVILFLPQLRTCLALVPPVRSGPAPPARTRRARPCLLRGGTVGKRRFVLLFAV